MSTCEEPKLLPVATALERMTAQVFRVTQIEPVPLSKALDRILAADIIAPLAVPAQDNSAMDGYALRATDTGPLNIIGHALAGHEFTGQVLPGTCVRIMTGAPIPAGADAVIMQENTQREGDKIRLLQPPRSAENIRRRGEDIQEGECILERGHRLNPVDIALLASLGYAEVRAWRRLKVAVLSTGDELVPPGQPLASGQIYDSNRHGICAMLQRLNVEVLDLGLIPDHPQAIHEAMQKASAQADAVISSGGVSVGDADFVKDILASMGEIHFWKVAIKPGKPFAFGQLGNSHFFGLPGNPVSALVTLHQLALPILRHMAGEQVAPPLTLQLPAASAFKKRPGRADYQRGCLVNDADNKSQVKNRGAQGSGVLTSFAGANCYVVLEQERGRVEEGEPVTVLPFDRFIS